MTIKGLCVIIQILLDLIFRRAALSFECSAAMQNLITPYLLVKQICVAKKRVIVVNSIKIALLILIIMLMRSLVKKNREVAQVLYCLTFLPKPKKETDRAMKDFWARVVFNSAFLTSFYRS